MLFALSLTAKEYEVNCGSFFNRMFFSKTSAEKAEFLNRTQIVSSLPDNIKIYSSMEAINELFFYKAMLEKAQLLSASLLRTSLGQVENAQQKGYKVCLMTAKNIDDVVSALLEKPDYILCDPKLDIARIKKILSEDRSATVKPLYSGVDLNNPKGCVLNYQTAVSRSNGTLLRVMSFNILAQIFGERRLALFRTDKVVEVIKNFDPDVAGLQEVDLHWYARLDTGVLKPLKLVYPPVYPYPPAIAIVYNSERFRLIDNGFFPFTDQWQKALNWVLLEDISNGKRFIFTNTHWHPHSVSERVKNAEMMVDSLKKIKGKYNYPVISVGDFNSRFNSKEYMTFISGSGMHDAVETSACVENKNISSWTYCKYMHTPLLGESHIDHVAYSDGLTPISARLILDKKVLEASDHLPLVVDFKY